MFATGSLIYKDLGESKTAEELNKRYVSLANVCQPIDFLPSGSDELFVGRAGYLCGALLLNRDNPNKVLIKIASESGVVQSEVFSWSRSGESFLRWSASRSRK